MKIREGTSDDRAAVATLFEAAFGKEEGPTVAALAEALFEDPSAQPLLSLVAEEADRTAGAVLFSAVRIEGVDGDVPSRILAPLGVAPDRQRRGIGDALVRRGLDLLRDRRLARVFVYGDPAYYGRFGFTANRNLVAPFPLTHPEGWQVLALDGREAGGLRGTVLCAASLASPEYW